MLDMPRPLSFGCIRCFDPADQSQLTRGIRPRSHICVTRARAYITDPIRTALGNRSGQTTAIECEQAAVNSSRECLAPRADANVADDAFFGFRFETDL